MSERQTPSPSPPAGEGGRERSERPGEGAFNKHPSPASRRWRSAPSPTGGEGTEQASHAPRPSVATTRARTLRSQMTDAERKLWFALRDRRFANFKFRRQVPLGPFIGDFVCFSARLVVEVDGSQHADSARDERRDRWLAANDFLVKRFWNNDVLANIEGVLTVILEVLHERTPHPARATRGRPSPAGGEGTELAARGANTAHLAQADRRKKP
jgi:very-short-patch-repair endonuclease